MIDLKTGKEPKMNMFSFGTKVLGHFKEMQIPSHDKFICFVRHFMVLPVSGACERTLRTGFIRIDPIQTLKKPCYSKSI